MAAPIASPLQGPAAAHQDLEGVNRPAIPREIPGDSPPVQEAAHERTTPVDRRVWPAQSSAPTRALLGPQGEARREKTACDLQSQRRRPPFSGVLRPGDRPLVRAVYFGQDLGTVPVLSPMGPSPLPGAGETAHRPG